MRLGKRSTTFYNNLDRSYYLGVNFVEKTFIFTNSIISTFPGAPFPLLVTSGPPGKRVFELHPTRCLFCFFQR